MGNEEAIANLVGLMMSFHIKIKVLPDKLKCAKCKSVLKNACQVPCGCRFCRVCIDDVISRGDQFCPGGSQMCGTTPLSTTVPDYRANKNVLKLTAKCPRRDCPHECSLADIEGHMRICLPQTVDYPFSPFYSLRSTLTGINMSKLGCAQGALPGEKMSGHLLQENCDHSEILIGTVANISRDMEMLKRELLLKDEHMENEMKSITDEIRSMKIENETMKDEIKSIKMENESIKWEKEMLCDRVQQLSEKLEREIDEKCQSDEQESAMVTVVTGAVASNQDEMEPVRGDIRSIRDQFDRIKCQMESIQMAMGLEQFDDWLIEDVTKTSWLGKTSGKFGLAHSFELESGNDVSGGILLIYLRIWPGPRDALLKWPFRGEVTVTIADNDRNKRDARSRQQLQCEIARPVDNQYSRSTPFAFWHTVLKGASVNLRRGVLVSCWIVPSAGQ